MVMVVVTVRVVRGPANRARVCLAVLRGSMLLPGWTVLVVGVLILVLAAGTAGATVTRMTTARTVRRTRAATVTTCCPVDRCTVGHLRRSAVCIL